MTSSEVVDVDQSLQVTFDELLAFRDYTATVYASNRFGAGMAASLDFMTLTGSKSSVQ